VAGDGPPGWRLLDWVLGLLVAVILFFMMAITLIDVVMRELLPGAFPAADELTKLSLGVLIFAALPLVTSRREHVVVTLFDGLFGNRGLAWKSALMNVIGAAVIGCLCWRLVLLALRFVEYGDRTTFLAFPLAPVVWFMVGAAAWTALILLALAMRDILHAVKGLPPGVSHGSGSA
jgi:TRAP-type C4-dicarboxylate transport system permease small subunit